MLTKITNMLYDYDFIQSKDKIYFSTRMVGNWGVLAFIPPKKFYHIKVNTHKDLSTECKNLKIIQSKYSEYIPQYIDYIEYEEDEFLICQAYQHEAFTKQQLEASFDLQNKLKYYFISSIADWSLHRAHENLVLKIADDFAFEDELTTHLKDSYTQLIAYGYQPQHCDLVLNNVALTDGHLIVFDWEDYAKVKVVGFDLAILLYSIYEFSSATLIAELATEKLDKIVMSYLTALNMDKKIFTQMFPLYLYLFLEIKKKYEYGEETILRTKNSLLESYQILKNQS